ncbi:MAG: DUF1588 domain-containing protein, partial [Myxococcota bacterium]
MKNTWMIGLLTLGLTGVACTGEQADRGLTRLGGADEATPTTPVDPTGPDELAQMVLDQREVDYGEALRLASLKLVGAPPSLMRIKDLDAASDKGQRYAQHLADFVDSPQFVRQMVHFWRNTFRQGGTEELDAAPAFAARILVEERPYTELFTATDNNCPRYDPDEARFIDGDCDNGVDAHAGVLTNPGTMAHFYGTMAFRRARWVQEMFACQKFPAEFSDTPQPMGAGQYTAPWNLDSISNDPIEFHDSSSVICANCHATMNHLAPLFGNFDEDGIYRAETSVLTPFAPEPIPTERSHWLPAGEPTAWRSGVPTPDLPSLGAAMAADPAVKACLAARLWNFVMSKEDIVTDLAVVPAEVIAPHVQVLDESGGSLR